MACRLSSGGVLLGPAEEATSCRGGNQQKWLQTTPVPMCHTTPVPKHKILYQTKKPHYHTSLAFGFTKACHTLPYQSAKMSANHTNTTPSQSVQLVYYTFIQGFRNYQPILTTISHDSLAYLQFTTVILVQYTQSKHRVAEGAISHRFRLRLVVAV